MKIQLILIVISLITVSCLGQNKPTDGQKMEQTQAVVFQEMNHLNLKLIDSEFLVLKTQKEADEIYKKINAANSSPRKNPIPTVGYGATYIVLQPKVSTNDFELGEVSQENGNFFITIKEINNDEYKTKKFPLSIIEVQEEISVKKITFKRIK